MTSQTMYLTDREKSLITIALQISQGCLLAISVHLGEVPAIWTKPPNPAGKCPDTMADTPSRTQPNGRLLRKATDTKDAAAR